MPQSLLVKPPSLGFKSLTELLKFMRTMDDDLLANAGTRVVISRGTRERKFCWSEKLLDRKKTYKACLLGTCRPAFG